LQFQILTFSGARYPVELSYPLKFGH